jgi:hypothetical protein
MKNFYDSMKFKKAEDAYKSHLHYLKNGFPENSANQIQQQSLGNYESYLPDQSNQNYNKDIQANYAAFQTPTSHYVPDLPTNLPAGELQKFQKSIPQFNQFNANQEGFNFDNNFSNALNNQFPGFGVNANGFGSENFNFDSNQFKQFSDLNTSLFQGQNQFSNGFNNNQFAGFGANANGFGSENFNFDSNQFKQFSNLNSSLFQGQNQFSNGFNNNQFPGFGANNFSSENFSFDNNQFL